MARRLSIENGQRVTTRLYSGRGALVKRRGSISEATAWQTNTIKKRGPVTRGDRTRWRGRGEKGEKNVHTYSPEKPTQWRWRDLTREVDDFKEKRKSFSRKRSYLLNRVNYFISTLVYMFLCFFPSMSSKQQNVIRDLW